MGDGYNAEAEIERLRGEVMAEITELKAATKLALAGVSNFRTYQDESRANWKRADKVFTTLEATEAAKKADTDKVRDSLQEHYQANEDRRGAKNLNVARAAMIFTFGMFLVAAASWWHDYRTPTAQDVAKQTVTEMLRNPHPEPSEKAAKK